MLNWKPQEFTPERETSITVRHMWFAPAAVSPDAKLVTSFPD
jgi:hypothetical protein